MTVWAMLVGMATLINITMVGALVSVAGNIPDSSFLAILSRYLRDKESPPGAVLYPVVAAARLQRLRRRMHVATAVAAAMAAALSLWALFKGWGAVAIAAITLWLLAANLAFIGIPLGLWRRRAGGIRDEDVQEAWKKFQPARQEDAADGESPDGGPD
jgi:hypothetical protein